MIEAGIYPTLSNADYHSDSAISRSGILQFIDSPFKYWGHYLNPNRPAQEQTEAMIFGSAFHTLILEPEKFSDEYIIKPEQKYLKYDGREAYESYKKEIEDIENTKKQVLSHADYKKLLTMHVAVYSNEKALELIRDAIYESSYFWQDAHTKIMCKSRPDILSHDYVIDLKTIKSASPRYFQAAMSDGSYHIQAAMIKDAILECEGREIKTFINICVEKTYPYQIGIYIISDEALEIGRQEYKQALLDMKVCFDNKNWPSYEIQTIDLPNWRRK